MTAPAEAVPVPVPFPKQVRDVVSGLLGREVTVRAGDPVLPGPDRPAPVAVYVDARTHTGALVAVDLELAAGIGAALGLVPAGVVDECMRAGALRQDIAENFYEVVNVLASVFNEKEGAPHQRLYHLHPVGDRLPGDVAGWLAQLGRRLDLAVSVEGYGDGGLSVVAVG
jgi:hypothetical protein